MAVSLDCRLTIW